MPSSEFGLPGWNSAKLQQLSSGGEGASLTASKSAILSEKLSSLKSVTNSARFINSVSDLYASDEIDTLLDEIRDLGPANECAFAYSDDLLQEFETDGSISRLPSGFHVDTTATATATLNCDSRTSVHSWDSHALYHNNTMDDPSTRQGGPISMYCDTNHLKTPIGILRIILLVASAVSLGCLVYSGTAKYGLFMLPDVGRIRFMIFVILFNSLITLLLIFLDISLLHHAFPIHYHKWVIAVYVILCSGFCGASALIVSLVHIYVHHYSWIAKVTRDQLIASSVFGFLAGLAALIMAIFATYELCRLYLPLREDTDQLTLTERASREMQRMQSSTTTTNSKQGRSLQMPPAGMEPPVTATIWPTDDVQPCSSKHIINPPNCNNMPSSSTGGGGGHGHHSHSRTSSGGGGGVSIR